MRRSASYVLVAAVLAVCTPTPLAAGSPTSGLPAPSVDANFPVHTPEKITLGQFLFFDKILSGNRNISCATCHHALTATGDGLSLSVGEGGRGLGVTRDTGHAAAAITERVPRNAPHVFNLGAAEFKVMFHDGRLSENPGHPSGFDSPAGLDLPPGLESALAAQAMFPVTSNTEMAGQPGENPVANAAAIGNLAGTGGVWQRLARRLARIPEYVELFRAAYDEVDYPRDITFVQAANALAAFEATAWRADDSPFDRYLRGEQGAMSSSAIQGMHVFYEKADCDSCHAGTYQTDHAFHAVAMPQVGPGKGAGYLGHDDHGRGGVTGEFDERYRFRTPTLRNVALTGPWGHDGAYDSLEAVLRHKQDPVGSLYAYDPEQLVLPSREDLDAIDLLCMGDPLTVGAIAAANELELPQALDDEDVAALLDFLHALTDRGSVDLRDGVPDHVPSRLPLAE